MISARRRVGAFLLTAAALLALLLWAVNTGSLHVTPAQLLRGLFVEYDPNVATVYDLRFPRIFIALFGGAATAGAGVLLQAGGKKPPGRPRLTGNRCRPL